MPRFHLGQKVLIAAAIDTKYRGRKATVISVQPNTHIAPGADKYIAQFGDGNQAEFWGIQLTEAPGERQRCLR
jgi:hypothetical protein